MPGMMQNCTAVDEALRERLGIEHPAFVAQLLPQLMELVRASRRLPVGEEHAIRRGSKEFLSASKELGQRSMSAVNRTMRWLDPDYSSGPADLVSFNSIEDSIDTVLERVDGCLRDALAGLTRSAEVAAEKETTMLDRESGSAADLISKPQIRWRELVDNDRTEFVPRLMVKHNERVPLSDSFLQAQRRAGIRAPAEGASAQASGASTKAAGSDAEPSALMKHLGALGVESSKASSPISNPYEEEIRMIAYPDSLFETTMPQHFGRMEDTPLVWVRTARELRQMINEVKATCVGKEIAVDVEHHDLRSYRGFVCLVQLSTRQKDFLIDPFDIFEQMHWLNEVFTDSSILKVLHGADRDVQWLQRDFSVYIVNMFDTGLATRSLKLQGGFSLANLVSHYCAVKLDKKYQTADWRQRPVPEEMAYYARCDTHYLLYCFDVLRNALLANATVKAGEVPAATADGVAAMRTVLDKSAALCSTQYTESPLDAANAAMRLCERFGSKQKPLETRQFACLKALASWRDSLARKLDESSNFIAPDACLWRVALALPSSPARLRSACNPLPLLLQQHAAEVVDVVIKSAEAAASADVPVSPMLMPARSQAALLQEAAASSSSSLLPPLSISTASSPSKIPMTPKYKEWPSKGCRDSSPIVRVSSGSLRHATNGAAVPGSASLRAIFESESSEEEMDVDVDALRDLAPAFARATAARPLPVAPVPMPAPVNREPAQAAASAAVLKEEAAGQPEPQSLREAYQLPSSAKRTKKKKRPLAATAVTPSAAPSLEAEADSFRSSLAAAFAAAPMESVDQPIPPRPSKAPRLAEPSVASDSYAASADPYGASASTATAPITPPPKPPSDPYVQAPPAAAAPLAAPRLGPDGQPLPRRKKKKKKARPTGSAPAPAVAVAADPYS